MLEFLHMFGGIQCPALFKLHYYNCPREISGFQPIVMNVRDRQDSTVIRIEFRTIRPTFLSTYFRNHPSSWKAVITPSLNETAII